MNDEQFIEKLTEIMDTDVALTMSTKLADVADWDSLSMVSFFTLCNSTLKRHVTPTEIKAAQTVEDLFKLANS